MQCSAVQRGAVVRALWACVALWCCAVRVRVCAQCPRGDDRGSADGAELVDDVQVDGVCACVNVCAVRVREIELSCG